MKNIGNNMWGNIINIAHKLMLGLKISNNAYDKTDAIWNDINRNVSSRIHNPIKRNIRQALKKQNK